MTYEVIIVNEVKDTTVKLGFIRILGMPTRNNCEPLFRELVRIGMAHKFATFTVERVAELDFEIPLKGARVYIRPFDTRGEQVELIPDNSVPTMLKATKWNIIKGWFYNR